MAEKSEVIQHPHRGVLKKDSQLIFYINAGKMYTAKHDGL
jgi:hypothetical protein